MNVESTEKFFNETKKAFKYLETDFQYRLNSSGIENEEYYQDTFAFVRYLDKKVGIEVYWYIASAVIGTTLVELIHASEFPSKKRFWGKLQGDARAINLQTLLLMLGKDHLLLLKRPRIHKLSEIKKRQKIIDENMSEVLKNLAYVLLTEAKDTLLGDTSMFPKVQEFEEALVKKENPY